MASVADQKDESIVQVMRRFPKQILSSININVSSFMVGVSVSSVAVIVGRLEEGNDVIQTTPEEASWIVSSLMLGMMASSFFCGHIAHLFGLKTCAILTNLTFLVGFLMILFGTSVITLSIGRFVLGAAAIGNRMSAQPLNCEFSNPKIRSFTGCIWLMTYSLGQCLIYLLGAFLPWRWAIGITLIPLILSTFGMFLMHESPVWLLTQGQVEKAELSLRFYDRSESEAIEEIKSIKEVMTVEQYETKKLSFGDRLKLKLVMIREPSFVKPCLYLIMVLITMEWSCFPFISSYLATKAPFDPYVMSIFATSARFAASLASGAILPKFPRRNIFLTSAVILLVCLSTLGTYAYLQLHDIWPEYLQYLSWLPLFAIIVIYLSSSIGYMNINLLLIGEILPAESKSLGNAIVTSFQFVASFSMVKSVPFLLETLGIYGLFWLFSGVVGFVIFFATLFMPETHELSLEEIQKNFGKSSLEKTTKIQLDA
ncbi:hypothetical protein TCAL_13460 [Tigriopus californicus]|uniref:Major facilitator superfamily (MFS) profile domain-containing protein n=1 Tax=Tigriopus californicus TaxID=6832 RepID=A0A553PM35_TIGCA|nr:hypothetical protein TCAL_13460 [Tigriopus californicus]